MLKNYLKIAWRNLNRNKGLSFINIAGLSVGMAFALLIGLWVQYEMSFDKFHKNIDRIAQVQKHTLFNNEKNTQGGIMLPLYDELKAKYPEVKRATRMDWGNHHSLNLGDKKFSKRGYYVDPDFLQMFTFPLVKGDPKTALNDPNSIILTESLAKSMFGDVDPIGKIVTVDIEYPVKVTAIAKDAPYNSTITFEFLAPFEWRVNTFEWIKNARTQWGNNFLMTMVEVKEGASMEALSKKLGPLVPSKNAELKNQTLFLQPLSKWHLYDEFKNWVNVGGRITYVRLFGIIGIFVLLIACINFMNLATARSEKRAREVGIRKAVGSRRSQLITQFLSESIFTTFLSFLLSLGLIQVLLPLVKDLGFEHIKFDFNNIGLLGAVLLACLVTGLIAGSYPAIYLSSFVPVKVLKGIIKQGKGPAYFRKVLVVSQFVISIGLIISTVIVYQQISHARNRSLGYDPDNLVMLYMNKDLQKNFNALKTDLLNSGSIEAVSKASSPMTGIWNSWSDFSWEGKDPHVDMSMDVVMTEWDYEKTAGLKFVAGRPFSRAFTTDSNAVILNEAALRMTGYKDPIGKTMKLGDQTLTIVGIIEDVLMKSPYKPVGPGVILFNADEAGVMFLRLKKTADIKKTLEAIRPLVEKHNPSSPFDFQFVDEEFGRKFDMERQVAKLSGIFAGLAIFISCLGLFGLAAFMAERRTKEIGIRKVLGASVTHLWILLSRDFVLMVLVASVIASPLALWLMTDWLQNYDYRIDISWWVFVIAGAMAMLIALITVSTQAIKAALANPVKSLRTE
jgi:putative ABC transport system permease protein